jgi:hypothetical protein
VSKSPFKHYPLEENRSRETEHIIEHMGKVFDIPGFALDIAYYELARRRELVDLLALCGRSKGLARLARATERVGYAAHERAGKGNNLKHAIAKARAEYADRIPAELMDWLERFFAIGWREYGAPVHPLLKAGADVMQRTPKVDKRGQRPLRLEMVSEYGSDRAALSRLRKRYAAFIAQLRKAVEGGTD